MKLVFKGIILLFLSLIFIPSATKAQDWEYGVSVGTSGYMGEYNLDNIFKFNSVSGSVGAKYNFNPTWGVKGSVSGIGIKWDDSQNINSNTIVEFSIIPEFNFFKFEPNKTKTAYTPYVFAGVGMLYSEDIVDKPFKPVVPFGVGFKYNLKSNFTLDSHLSYRLAGTDMLDGSGSGWKGGFWDKVNQIDSYMTFQIGITYTFFKQGCPTW